MLSHSRKENIIRAKFQEIINCKKGDALKMKWILPAYIKDILDNNELSFLNEAIRSRKKLKEVSQPSYSLIVQMNLIFVQNFMKPHLVISILIQFAKMH